MSVFFSPCAPGDPVSPFYECINSVQECLVNYSHLVLFLKCCLFLVSFFRCYVYLYVLRVSPACLVLPLFWTNTAILNYPMSPYALPPYSSIADRTPDRQKKKKKNIFSCVFPLCFVFRVLFSVLLSVIPGISSPLCSPP